MQLKILLIAMISMLLLFTTPVLADSATFTGAGTADSPYLITSAGDLIKLSSNVADGRDYQNNYFKLTSDITIPSGVEWTPIGLNYAHHFSSNFDGDCHTITGLKNSSSGDNIGLFGYVIHGNISNVTVKNVDFKGVNKVGALIGVLYHDGDKDAHYVSNCHATGIVSGANNVGALIGSVDLRTSNVLQIEQCSVDVKVNGASNIGGLIGNAQPFMYDYARYPEPYNTERAPSKIIIHDNHIGSEINGAQGVGGLIGNVMLRDKCSNVTAYNNIITPRNINGAPGDADTIDAVGGVIGNLCHDSASANDYDGILIIKNNVIITENINGNSNVARVLGKYDAQMQPSLTNNYAYEGIKNNGALIGDDVSGALTLNGTGKDIKSFWCREDAYNELSYSADVWSFAESDDGVVYPYPVLKIRDAAAHREHVSALTPTYKVTFYQNNDDTTTVVKSVKSGEPMSLVYSGNLPNYKFLFWSDTANGAKKYINGDSITHLNDDVTLYAVFAREYGITANGGAGVKSINTIAKQTAGEYITVIYTIADDYLFDDYVLTPIDSTATIHSITHSGNVITFLMPQSDVKIVINAKKKPATPSSGSSSGASTSDGEEGYGGHDNNNDASADAQDNDGDNDNNNNDNALPQQHSNTFKPTDKNNLTSSSSSTTSGAKMISTKIPFSALNTQITFAQKNVIHSITTDGTQNVNIQFSSNEDEWKPASVDDVYKFDLCVISGNLTAPISLTFKIRKSDLTAQSIAPQNVYLAHNNKDSTWDYPAVTYVDNHVDGYVYYNAQILKMSPFEIRADGLQHSALLFKDGTGSGAGSSAGNVNAEQTTSNGAHTTQTQGGSGVYIPPDESNRISDEGGFPLIAVLFPIGILAAGLVIAFVFMRNRKLEDDWERF